jgi:proline dehydrogenase
MEDVEHQWTLPDWKSTLRWCKKRNDQSIRCTIDVLGENSKNEEEVENFVKEYKTVINSVYEERIKAAPTLKLTALGANFDRTLCTEKILELYTEAKLKKVPFEMDVEGTPIVDYTLDTVYHISSDTHPVTLAIQAYLNRSTADLYSLMDKGVKVRLVKGAYQGDVDIFSFIQERFKFLFIILMDSSTPFSVGTHDPDLIEWIREKAGHKRESMEFGFLKGFADETKLELVEDGWKVSEYVPFGINGTAYEARRKKYITDLEAAKREPVT